MNTNVTCTTIYTGSDSTYWKKYGRTFVKSFHHFNPDKTIHVHLCNPTEEDLEELKSLPCNFSFEYIEPEYILELKEFAKTHLENNFDEAYKSNLKYCSKFYSDIVDIDEKLFEMMKFTIFACKRFIKLSEMWSGQYPIVAFDIDSICRGPIDVNEMLSGMDQGCLSVKGNRFVVSLVAFRNNSQLLKDWGESLKETFETKKVYNFLDQDTFVKFSENYAVKHIERKFCDHTNKSVKSLVMTGKGSFKHDPIFLNEQARWNV